MNFEDTELIKKRSFYSQTGFASILFNGYVDSLTGIYTLGVSGASQIEFVFSGGKIYQNGNHIHSYQPFREFALECQISSGSYNVAKDGAPLVFGEPKSTGAFDTFYITRNNLSDNLFYDLNVSGNTLPIYRLNPNGYLTVTGQTGVTGYFINQGNFPIRIFDSVSLTPDDIIFNKFSGSIAAGATGLFDYAADFNEVSPNQSILTTFNTNFNDVSIFFNIVDLRNYNLFVLLNENLNFAFDSGNIASSLVFYNNYSGGVQSDFPTHLSVKLDYVSGSGSNSTSNFNEGIAFQTTGYGNFKQSGILTGNYSVQTGNGILTGTFVVSGSKFAWATGAATGYFSGQGIGWGSGINYTGLATAPFTGLATGLIYPNSGTLLFNGSVSVVGTPTDAVSLGFTGYLNATGRLAITGLKNGDYFYINSLSAPLVRNLQFFNETGLVYYLSGQTSVHNVKSWYLGSYVYLEALSSGTLGNGLPIVEGQCELGSFVYTPFLTGGVDIGTSGVPVVPIGPYTGSPIFTITGSGFYSDIISGTSLGIFTYITTFTGSWDLLTGQTSADIISIKNQGFYNASVISGSGLFLPNNFFAVTVTHNRDVYRSEGARLTISGDLVFNPLTFDLSN